MPDLFAWKPEFSVGNQILDCQHKELLKLCERASSYQCDKSKASVDAFHALLDELAFYATKHFETEEQILLKVSYPKLSLQQQEHDEYSEKMVGFLLAAIDGEIDNIAVQNFLKIWWINHILGSDMEYSSYVKCHDDSLLPIKPN